MIKPPDTLKPTVFIVTGLSGAGRSTALKALGDIGFYVIDNLPLVLLRSIDTQMMSSVSKSLFALAINSQTIGFSSNNLLSIIDNLRDEQLFSVYLIYLDCDNEILIRRYTETRRRHPLAIDRPVVDGISQERILLEPLKDQADLIIDTSHMLVADLKERLKAFAQSTIKNTSFTPLSIQVVSFSYRLGLPREADLVFDMRFLRNPHYNEQLRPLNGQNQQIADFIRQDKIYAPFFDILVNQLKLLLPAFEHEGKSYLTIALGCTGGKHRSVFVAEETASWLKKMGFHVSLKHRDLAAEMTKSE